MVVVVLVVLLLYVIIVLVDSIYLVQKRFQYLRLVNLKKMTQQEEKGLYLEWQMLE